MVKRFLVLAGTFVVLGLFTTVAVTAQSPNTATMVVVVVDQNGAFVKDAKVSVANSATGAHPYPRLAPWATDLLPLRLRALEFVAIAERHAATCAIDAPTDAAVLLVADVFKIE